MLNRDWDNDVYKQSKMRIVLTSAETGVSRKRLSFQKNVSTANLSRNYTF